MRSDFERTGMVEIGFGLGALGSIFGCGGWGRWGERGGESGESTVLGKDVFSWRMLSAQDFEEVKLKDVC